MAITAQQKANLLGVTSFMFNYAPDQDSFGRFEAIIEANPSFYALGTNLARTEAYQSQFAEGITRDEKIDVILGRLGLTEGAGYETGVNFIKARLDAGIPEGQVLMEIGEKMLQDPAPAGLEEASAIFQNKIAASEAYLESGIAGYSSDTLPDLLANITADAASVEEAQAAIDAVANEGETFSLTADAAGEVISLTANNDTVNAEAGALKQGTVLADQGGNDTLNATITSAFADGDATINGVENVVFDWDAFGTATVDATGIKGVDGGSTITLTSSKTGYLGNATVNDTGANNVTAGEGIVRTLNVNGATDTTVDGGAAATVNVDGSATRADNVAATVTAGANTTSVSVGATNGFDTVSVTGGESTTTVTVDDSANITVDAAAADTVTIDGTAENDDTATVTLGGDADLNAGNGALIEDVTLNAAADSTVDINGSAIETLNVVSEGAVTLETNSADLNGNTVTNATAGLTIETTHDGAHDLSDVEADTIRLTSSNGTALTLATGANVLLADDVALNATAVFNGQSATDGTLNLTVQNDQAQDIAVTNLKTLNLEVALNADDADDVATLGGITSAEDVVLTSENDVDFADVNVRNLDASAASGALTIQGNGANLESVVGSQGANDITLNNFTNEVSVVTAEGDDKVTLGAAVTNDLTLVLGNGDNEVDGSGFNLVDADLSIVAGSGDDVVDVTVESTSGEEANFVAELGDGNNEVTLTTVSAGTAQNSTIITGAGNDTVALGANTNAQDVITLELGAGVNTLNLGGFDATAGELNLSGVTHILDSDGTSVVTGALLNGQDYTIQGDGKSATQLDVTIGTAGSFDFSGLTLDNTLSNGIGGLDITGAGADTIVATSGDDAITAADVAGAATFTGGAGADTYTLDDSTAGKAGTATVVIGAGDTGTTATTVDEIVNFETGVDKLKIGIEGSTDTFGEVDVDTGATDQLADAAAALAAANTAFGTGGALEGKNVGFLFDSDTGTNGGWLAIDRDADGITDELVELTGLSTSGDVVATDVIA